MPGPLDHAHTVAKLPAQDLDRARAFYRDKLGLEPVEERAGGLRYLVGPSEFHLFSSSGKPSGESTQMAFEVENLEVTIAELRAWMVREHGVAVSHPVMWETLRRLNLTVKKSGSVRRSRTGRILPRRALPGAAYNPSSMHRG